MVSGPRGASTSAVEPEVLNGQDEELRVQWRRYQEARAAGLSFHEATAYAESGQDIGLLRSLVAHGCPPRLLRRIVRAV